MTAPRLVFLSLLAAGAGQVLYYYPRLPERMASHFDGRGRPNGWSTKETFFAIDLGVLGLMALIFLVLPVFLSRLPTGLINMPRKDYWLAPERRAASLARMARYLTWFGCSTLVLLFLVFEMTIRANLDGTWQLPSTPVWTLLGTYAAFVVVWLVRMLFAFSVPRSS